MAKIAATTYNPTEKANPFVEIVAPFVQAGIDSAFQVTFDEADYKREKLLIQKAVNELGASAREVESEQGGEDGTVVSTFVIRPKRKAGKDVEPAADEQGDTVE